MNDMHDETVAREHDLDLRDLRYFAACCEEGQLTAAARRLHIGQPTLSHAMARLERRLGEPLLERPAQRRAGVSPTAAGLALWARARAVAGEMAGLHDDLAALHGVVRGDLRIASIQSVNATLLPGPLARFATAHPGVAITLRTLSSDEVPAAVRDGRVELGFLAGPPRERPADLEARLVLREAFVALVRADHPLAQAGEIPFRRLAEVPLVLVPPDTPTGVVIARACRQAGISPRVLLRLESGEALRETVRAGLGCTILPEGYLPVHDRGLVAVRLSDPTPRRDVVVASRSGQRRSRAAEAFLLELDKPPRPQS